MTGTPLYEDEARPGEDGMVVCPCCEGTGRVGPKDAACQACWMVREVPAWRRPLLIRDLDWWHRRQGWPKTPPTAGVERCQVCDPDDPCRWCPLQPFSLAA